MYVLGLAPGRDESHAVLLRPDGDVDVLTLPGLQGVHPDGRAVWSLVEGIEARSGLAAAVTIAAPAAWGPDRIALVLEWAHAAGIAPVHGLRVVPAALASAVAASSEGVTGSTVSVVIVDDMVSGLSLDGADAASGAGPAVGLSPAGPGLDALLDAAYGVAVAVSSTTVPVDPAATAPVSVLVTGPAIAEDVDDVVARLRSRWDGPAPVVVAVPWQSLALGAARLAALDAAGAEPSTAQAAGPRTTVTDATIELAAVPVTPSPSPGGSVLPPAGRARRPVQPARLAGAIAAVSDDDTRSTGPVPVVVPPQVPGPALSVRPLPLLAVAAAALVVAGAIVAATTAGRAGAESTRCDGPAVTVACRPDIPVIPSRAVTATVAGDIAVSTSSAAIGQLDDPLAVLAPDAAGTGEVTRQVPRTGSPNRVRPPSASPTGQPGQATTRDPQVPALPSPATPPAAPPAAPSTPGPPTTEAPSTRTSPPATATTPSPTTEAPTSSSPATPSPTSTAPTTTVPPPPTT